MGELRLPFFMTLALGFLETRGLVAAIEACDAMLKAAQVTLVQRQVISPAIVTICVRGETAAVQAAVDAGLRAAERIGRVLSSHVIPSPAEGIDAMVEGFKEDVWAFQQTGQAPTSSQLDPPASAFSQDDLFALAVPKLRALARSLSHFPLSGRQISLAKRKELLALLKERLFS
jgi:ethanolamine utilization protein EutM